MSGEVLRCGSKCVEWNEVAPVAKNLFSVWVTGSEIKWAEKAWAYLKEAGLAQYENAVTNTRVWVRLLALAAVYRDFCHIGVDEAWEGSEIHDWAAEMCLNEFRLAQIAGAEFRAGVFDADADELAADALCKFVNEDRKLVCAALVKGFGADWKLTEALFASVKPSGADVPSIFIDDPDAAGMVLAWIGSGMHGIL